MHINALIQNILETA